MRRPDGGCALHTVQALQATKAALQIGRRIYVHKGLKAE
jgi:hypothetical protein